MIRTLPELFAFLHHWHAPWLPQAQSCAMPSLPMPAPLAALYAEFTPLIAIRPSQRNAHRAPFATQDHLMCPTGLTMTGEMLAFAVENQGNWSARCATTGDNPPVYSDAALMWEDPDTDTGDGDGDGDGFSLAGPSLSHFLTTLCLQEACMSAPHLVACGTGDAPDLHAVLSADPQPLWLHAQLVHGPNTHQFHHLPAQGVLVMQAQDTVWVAAQTPEVLALIRPGIAQHIIFPT
jgi:hypothetical protein